MTEGAMNPKISVVIPCYNSGKTIERAVISVLNQTFPPHEIIVVDDGSTDDTLIKISKYHEKIILHKQKNSGAAAARNVGAKIAQGDYLAFLDSDDVWHPEKLRIQGSILERDKTIGISSTGYTFVDEQKYSENLSFKEIEESAIVYRKISFIDIFETPYLATPTVIMKKSLFDLVGGFDETLETAEDIDLWLRSCAKQNYIFVENVLCKVITQNNGLTSRAALSPFLAHIAVIDKFSEENPRFIKENLRTINKVKSIVLTNFASSLLCDKKKAEARKTLLKAFKKHFHLRTLYLYFKTLY